ncbi:hypothetical protein JD844_006109 [Phrynosoma platyrhinos]|uniref:Immunoglobulin domain-containing protein n=1 Tax=Phrynosoma platyrhinos TaxID=52577 RepID=A0ABQ7TPR4_PHRPL|nr:hypothetical protein JD844_006109 [Phrynosoma platyrhinos]
MKWPGQRKKGGKEASEYQEKPHLLIGVVQEARNRNVHLFTSGFPLTQAHGSRGNVTTGLSASPTPTPTVPTKTVPPSPPLTTKKAPTTLHPTTKKDSTPPLVASPSTPGTPSGTPDVSNSNGSGYPYAPQTSIIHISITMLPNTSRLGGDVTLTPEGMTGMTSCTWYRGNEKGSAPIMTYKLPPVSVIEKNVSYSGRESVGKDCSLHISNLTPNDSAVYTIKATRMEPEGKKAKGLSVMVIGVLLLLLRQQRLKPKLRRLPLRDGCLRRAEEEVKRLPQGRKVFPKQEVHQLMDFGDVPVGIGLLLELKVFPSNCLLVHLFLLLLGHILSSCFSPTAAQNFTILVSAEPWFPVIGTNVTLMPRGGMENFTTCSWYRWDISELNQILVYELPPSTAKVQYMKAYTGRETVRPDCSLHIRNVSVTDITYFLILKNSTDHAEVGHVFLVVTGEQRTHHLNPEHCQHSKWEEHQPVPSTAQFPFQREKLDLCGSLDEINGQGHSAGSFMTDFYTYLEPQEQGKGAYLLSSSCFTLTHAGKNVSIEIRQEPRFVEVGQDVSLIPGGSKHIISCKWLQGDKYKYFEIFRFLAYNSSVEYKEAYSGRQTLKPDCSLHIRNLTPADSNFYAIHKVTARNKTEVGVRPLLVRPLNSLKLRGALLVNLKPTLGVKVEDDDVDEEDKIILAPNAISIVVWIFGWL